MTDFVSCFSCHSHSDLGNVYLLVMYIGRYWINFAEITMTMTEKIRYNDNVCHSADRQQIKVQF